MEIGGTNNQYKEFSLERGVPVQSKSVVIKMQLDGAYISVFGVPRTKRNTGGVITIYIDTTSQYKETADLADTAVTNSRPIPDARSANQAVSNSILNRATQNVKGNKLSFADDDYISAVENGDTDTAERMVQGNRSPADLYRNTVGEIEAEAAARTGEDQQAPIPYGQNAVAVVDYAGDGDRVRYSLADFEVTEQERKQIEEDRERLREQIERYERDKEWPAEDHFVLGSTPCILQEIGLSALPMTMDLKHVNAALYGTKDDGHWIGKDMLLKLQELMADPIAVIASGTKTDKIIMVLIDADIRGERVCTPIRISTHGRIHGLEYDINKLTTAHGRENAASPLKEAIEEDSDQDIHVFYIKKRRPPFPVRHEPASKPSTRVQEGLRHKITESESPVKVKNGARQTNTVQFRRWFKRSKSTIEDNGNH